ncbi:hypothetical protein [Streptomyces sp. NPDC093094]|uniref:hypothetical protein n=1 Tax=Streptomyces sp. NPDC093094 TaxID=3366026 RepID=UPI003816B275
MSKPLRMSRRRWVVAAWAVLCVAGFAATAALDAFPAPGAHSEEPVSVECAEYIRNVEKQLAEAEREGNDDGVVAFTRVRVGADDCSDEVVDHFRDGR